MATINVQAAPSAAGAAVNFAAVSAGGDTIATGHARTRLRVNNASGSAVTVTLAGKIKCSAGFLHDQTIACPAGEETDAEIEAMVVDADGNVAATYSASASVTVAAVVD